MIKDNYKQILKFNLYIYHFIYFLTDDLKYKNINIKILFSNNFILLVLYNSNIIYVIYYSYSFI